MAYRPWRSGIWVAVLCQIGTLAACSGSVTDENSHDPGAGGGGVGSGSTSGDGDSSGSGGSQMGTGGAGDAPIICPDIATALGAIILVGAPASNGRCLASLEITVRGNFRPALLNCARGTSAAPCG